MSPEDRVQRARQLISAQIDDLLALIAISESNQIIVYSPTLSSQIPTSYAANAFNSFQRTALDVEIVKICTLWDKAASDRSSIPTVSALINDPQCKSIIEQNLGPGTEYAAGHMHRLERAVRITAKVYDSRIRTALYEFRNARLAHRLIYQSKSAPAALPKFGYERTLLRTSISLVNNFNNAVCDSDFAFDLAIRNSKKNAAALWHGCKFEVLR